MTRIRVTKKELLETIKQLRAKTRLQSERLAKCSARIQKFEDELRSLRDETERMIRAHKNAAKEMLRGSGYQSGLETALGIMAHANARSQREGRSSLSQSLERKS